MPKNLKKRNLAKLLCFLLICIIFILFFSISRPLSEQESGIRINFGILLARIMNLVNFFVHLFFNKVFYVFLSIIVFTWIFKTLINKFNLFNKRGGFSSVYIIVFVFVLIWILVLSAKKIDVYNQPINNTPAGEIYGETKIGQTFVSAYNNLTAVDVLLATYNRTNTGEFIFHLRENPDSKKDLFSYTGDISRLKDNSYFSFRFPEIQASKGKEYYFYF